MKNKPIELLERTLAAYHEAGHAAALFLLGEWSDLTAIDMRPRPRLGHVAICRTRNVRLFTLRSGVSACLRVDVARELFLSLLGPAAEAKYEDCPDWAFSLEFLQDVPGSDMAVANEVVRFLHTDRPSQCDLIYRMVAWCDQILADYRVWAAVSALAARLERQWTMSGRVAMKSMHEAWLEAGGSGYTVPLWTMPKWRQRFFMTKPELSALRQSCSQSVAA